MGQLGRSVAIVVGVGLLFVPAASGAQAEPVLSLAWGTTLAEAAAEASEQATACARRDAGCSTRAPAPSTILAAGSSCSANSVPVMAWRRAAELSDGKARASSLARLASSREVFDCTGNSCSMVLRTGTPQESQSDVSTLSVCQAQVVKGVAGAPARCQEAMKEHATVGALLRAQVGNSFVHCSMGLRDFDAVFKGRGSDLSGVRRVLMDVLAAKPFNLAVMEDRGGIIGTRMQLASEVLKGWREWVTVRVDVDTRDSDAGTSISTTMLVSKQAATEREAWTAASESQEQTYLVMLRNELQRRGALITTGLRR